MWICSKCGTKNSDNSQYCGNCGQNCKEQNENESGTINHSKEHALRNILVAAVIIVMIAAVCAIFVTKNSIYGFYLSESGTYSVSLDKDGSCHWYQDGIRFDGSYERDGQHLILKLTGRSHYSDTQFSAEVEDHNLRILGGTVNNELFIKQKKPEEIKSLDSIDFTESEVSTLLPTIDTGFVNSPSGVSIVETILLDESGIKVTALRYEESAYSFASWNRENIAFHVENDRTEKISVAIAYVKINGVVQCVYPSTDSYYIEKNSECDGVIEIDPEYILLSGNEHIHTLEISLVIRDENFDDVCVSSFVVVPIVDQRTHQFYSTPLWISIIEDEHINMSVLGYKIDDRQLHLYFYLQTDDKNREDDRYIEFLGGREEYSSGGEIIINGVRTDMYMWQIYDGEQECGYTEVIYFAEPTEAITKLEFAFVIYGVDRNRNQKLPLFSSDAIVLTFDEQGGLISADGTLTKNMDCLEQYYQ